MSRIHRLNRQVLHHGVRHPDPSEGARSQLDHSNDLAERKVHTRSLFMERSCHSTVLSTVGHGLVVPASEHEERQVITADLQHKIWDWEDGPFNNTGPCSMHVNRCHNDRGRRETRIPDPSPKHVTMSLKEYEQSTRIARDQDRI